MTGKRRKIRCFFLSSRDAICVGCQRRGIACLGQEYCDEDRRDESKVSARLERVESLLQRLVDRSDDGGGPLPGSGRPARTPALSAGSGAVSPADNRASRTGLEASARLPQGLAGNRNNYDDIRRALHEALPSQHDAEILIGSRQSSALLLILSNPLGDLFRKEHGSSNTSSDDRGPVVLPHRSSHPVLLARTLLQLALSIQQLDHSFDYGRLHMPRPKEAMAEFHSLASSLVTTNDELLDSLEAIECLFIEGVYFINSGAMRRALHHWRRTVTVAQLVGLHLDRPLRLLDPHTRATPCIMQQRIVRTERYLSILLGVTSLTSEIDNPPDDNSGAAATSAAVTDSLERLHARAICAIDRRNRFGGPEAFAATLNIDFELQQSAANLSWPVGQQHHQQWWEPLRCRPGRTIADGIEAVVRAQAQTIHFHILNMLHLPYMLRNGSEPRYDYSKAACLAASREVLTRFVAFRTLIKVVFSCRFIDFCALTACLTLLLAYLDGHQMGSGTPVGARVATMGLSGNATIARTQRLEDRALVEKVLSTMDELNSLNGDDFSHQTAVLARKLLAMEADAARSGPATYHIGSCTSRGNGQGDDDGHRSLFVTVPHFGTVSVNRREQEQQQQGVPAVTPIADFTDNNMHNQALWQQQQLPGMQAASAGPPALFGADANNWAFQGADTAFLDIVLGAAGPSGYYYDGNDADGGSLGDLECREVMS